MRRILVFVIQSPSGGNINAEDAALNISDLHSVRFIYVQYRSKVGYVDCATVWAINKPDLDYGQGNSLELTVANSRSQFFSINTHNKSQVPQIKTN
jgi:hypothetical protein